MNSITIVKNGDAEKSQKAKGLTKRFECAVCGCVFDATNDTRDFYSRTSCEVRRIKNEFSPVISQFLLTHLMRGAT